MTKMSKPIVFFGSGPVAAASLALLVQDFTIEAVVTKPRPAHHKGDVPVLRVAEQLNLPVFTVTNKKTLDQLIDSNPFKSDVAILIDFGIIVSQKAIDFFPLGIINSHFSLLPEWRGADPITFSILSGQKQTGVSLMLLTAGMDEGPLLAQAPFELPPTITTPELTEELIQLSHLSLKEIVPLYCKGEIEAAPQEAVTMASSTEPTYSRKLSKEDSVLDFTKPAEQLEKEVRAFAEWPKSRTIIGGLEVVITRTSICDLTGKPGDFAIHNKQLVVYCGQKALQIDALKPAGKKEMTGQAFLAGYKHLIVG